MITKYAPYTMNILIFIDNPHHIYLVTMISLSQTPSGQWRSAFSLSILLLAFMRI